MAVSAAYMVPHPPLIVPDIGRGAEAAVQSTVDAYRKAAGKIGSLKPDIIVVLSPHQIMYADYFHISPGEGAVGDFGRFGAGQVSIEVSYDTEFVDELCIQAQAQGLAAGTLGVRGRQDRDLDHGTMVPLYFVDQYWKDYKLVRIGLSGLPLTAHYELGQCIQETAQILGRNAVVIASGDLSHKLKDDGPYGFAPEGPEFDRQITGAMAEGDFLRFLTMDPALCDRAAECGLRSFQIMTGALDGMAVETKLLSYEGVTGVGYGVAAFTVTGPDGDRRFGEQCVELERTRLAEKKASEDSWVRLARLSLETFVKTGERLERLPDDLPAEMTEQAAGAFVSLHAHGQLRGCIGTTGPTTESVAWEIVQNAVSACSRDPRFPPVTVSELDILEYSVDVLGQPEPISSPAELDVKKYGVIVSCGGRRGLLLPDLEGVDTVEQQIDIARQKGGISSREKCTLGRFEVVRHL